MLLHGFLCDSRAWRRQLDDLAEGFRVVAWDAPGRGSPPIPLTVSRSPTGRMAWGAPRRGWGAGSQPCRALLGRPGGRGVLPALPVSGASPVLASTYAGWLGSFGEEVARQRLERCERESHLSPGDFVARGVPEEFFHDAGAELTDEMAGVVSDFHPVGFRLVAQSLAEVSAADGAPVLSASCAARRSRS